MKNLFQNLKKSFSFQLQKGASLLEVMVGIGVLGIFVSAMMSTMDNISKETKIVTQSATIFESDQMVRYELSNVFDQFQRLLIQTKTTSICKEYQLVDENGKPLLNASGKTVSITPWNSFKKSQSNFLYSREIYFGHFSDLKAENIPTFQNEVVPVFDDLITYGADSLKAKKIIDAYKRCESQTVRSNTTSMANRTSFYVCGFGPGVLVEAKIAFWDFFMGNELLCEAMNGNAGRGLQVIYTAYSFRQFRDNIKSSSSVNKKKISYQVKSYDSRIFLPKRIDTFSD